MPQTTLQQFLAGLNGKMTHSAALVRTVECLAAASAQLAGAIADGSQNADFAIEGDVNVQGETQKYLDVLAHRIFMQAATDAKVHCVLSEEEEQPVSIDPTGVLALAIDPLDGSSNIVINGTIGTIFGLYPVTLGGISDQFLRPGKDLLAAAYVVYGPRTEIVLSLGSETKRFVLHGDRTNWLFAGDCTIPKSASEFAINASNHRHWSKEVRNFVNFCVEGRHGPYAEDYNMGSGSV
jgi:fructose-1,6-bisphosphatase I